jgi:transposase-like protein
MKKRHWEPKTKTLIVLQGLRGKPINELCAEHQISQAQYYQWRDQFLSDAHSVFEISQKSRREFALEREVAQLKHMVGELTMELKKSDLGLL